VSEPGSDIIRFEDLQKSFGPKVVFDGLNLTVKAQETLTVIGGSGSGKSVLLKSLIGLLHPDSGRIDFKGEEITYLSEQQFLGVRQQVAYVFQGSALFDSLTVGENIAYPLREHFPKMGRKELAERVARTLSLVNLPGIEAMVPADLSGGMKKRVGLARAIATQPEVILWDEPTTGLDPISTRIIEDLILRMKAELGCTSIVVTHDMPSAFYVSDRMALLANRKIVEVGTVPELQASRNSEVRAFLDARLPRAGSRGGVA
jgi:phospholipid/cholesterol/gamma-HCH transport system ATP-binding protein